MRTLFLLVAVGAATAGLHALAGLMLTPFFGASPLFWSNLLVSLPVSISLGLVLGRPLRGRSKKDARIPFRLGTFAGLVMMATPIAIPVVARMVLNRDPDALLAPAATVFLLVTLPAALACAVLPNVGRANRKGAAARADAGLSSAGAPLLLFAAGATAGVALCWPALQKAGEIDAWIFVWLIGGLLLAAGLAGLGKGRALGVLGALAVATTFLAQPSELRSFEYKKALEQAWQLRVGRYYLQTAGSRALADTEVLRQYEELRGQIDAAPSKQVVALLVVETLKQMGAVQITGDGLRSVLDLYLPEVAKPYTMPLFERIEAIRSDGRGTVSFSLRWHDGEESVRVDIPTVDDGILTFVFASDFELTIHVDEDEESTVTAVAVGPIEIEKAGFFESHDTLRTPVLLEDVSFFFDAHLLGLTVTSRKDRAVVRVRAQGVVGGVKEKTIQVIDLD